MNDDETIKPGVIVQVADCCTLWRGTPNPWEDEGLGDMLPAYICLVLETGVVLDKPIKDHSEMYTRVLTQFGMGFVLTKFLKKIHA